MADTSTDETTTPGSEENPAPSGDAGAGSGSSGEGGGSQSDADTFAAERDRLEAERRQWQSEADKLRKENEALKAAKDGGADSSTGLSLEEVRAEFLRAQAIGAEASRLATSDELKFADKAILDRAAEYDSPEALRAAVEQSHNERKAFLESVGAVPKSDVEQQLAAYRERYGDLPSPPDTSGAQATGTPTVEQIGAMTFAERDAYEAEHGKGSLQQLISKQMRSEAQGGSDQ